MAPTTRCIKYSIIQGPDQMGLSAAQYYITPNGDRLDIEFTLDDHAANPMGARSGRVIDHNFGLDRVIRVKVDGALREDGSGRNWMLRCSAMLKDGFHHVTCFYSTGRRSGTLVIWDSEVIPPSTFATFDGETSRLVPHGT